jgi:uncharacterized protein
MIVDFSLMFLLGAAASIHCIGMCGPLIAVATSSAVEFSEGSWLQLAVVQSAYHAGRLIMYFIIGALIASLGQSLEAIGSSRSIGSYLQIGIGAGLIITALFPGFSKYFHSKSQISARIMPAALLLLQSKQTLSMFFLGCLTGLFPCGVLYSAFSYSLAAQSGFDGGIIMAAFWLGTLPLLLFAGMLSGGFFCFIRRYAKITIVAATLAAGAWLSYRGIFGLTHSGHSCCSSMLHNGTKTETSP